MKKNSILIMLLLSLANISFGQNKTSKSVSKSPEATFTQQFGESQIVVSYARPSARGRKIFGSLVPYDSLWRTGASDCTTLEFKEALIIGGKKIEKGKYSLFSIPSQSDWTIVLNSETFMHGTTGYKSEKDVLRFKVAASKTERFYETFSIEMSDFTLKGEASLNLIWENTLVKIPLQAILEDATITPILAKMMYECPMKCEPATDKAGKCGKCKMDLKEIKK